VRSRVEHVFGYQTTAGGATIVRRIGIAPAKMNFGMQNFSYDTRRFVTLDVMAAAASAPRCRS